MTPKKNPQLVLTYDGINISEKDLKCLKPMTFLNDNIINFYLKYMYRCLLDDRQRQKVHIFDSFFCEALDQIDETRVQRWLRRVNIFEKEILMVPAMIDEHWFLIVVRNPCAILNRIDAAASHFGNSTTTTNINNNDNGNNSNSTSTYRTHRKQPAIMIMDSMPGHVQEKKPQLLQYVYNFIRIACSIKGKAIHVRRLREIMPSRECDAPLQTNNYDCGLHLLANAEKFFIDAFGIPQEINSEIEFRLSSARRRRDALRKFIDKLAEAMEIERDATN